jgi:hypothetical protein
MLCGFTGLLSPWPHSSDASSSVHRSERGSPLVSPSLQAEVSLLRDLVASPSARMAAVAVFGIAHRLGSSLRHGWQPILRIIFRMRDLHILDPGMLVESDGDLLDPIQRRLFNSEVLSQRKKLLKERSQNSNENKGGLLRWIFGGGGGSGKTDKKKKSKLKPRNKFKHVEMWNHGAHTDASKSVTYRSEKSLLSMSHPASNQGIGGSSSSLPVISPPNGMVDDFELPSELIGGDEDDDDDDDDDDDEDGASSLNDTPEKKEEIEQLTKERSNLRAIATQQVAACQVSEIIWDSRELSEPGLWALLHSLTAAIHAHLPPDEMSCLIKMKIKKQGDEDDEEDDDEVEEKKNDKAVGSAPNNRMVERIDERVGLLPLDQNTNAVNVAPREVYLPPLSSACLPFAEVLLTEISLRNRDRVACTWPLLKEHYKRRLQGAKVVSFGVEKAATGLLRLVARVASRPGMSTQMLSEALSWLLPTYAQPEVVRFLSTHLGCGLLRIVRHTDSLVELPPHHWNALFGLLQICAESKKEGS